MPALFRHLTRLSFAPALYLCACALAFFPRAASARATVVEDSPGRLVIDVSVRDYAAGDGVGGSRLLSSEYGGPSEVGAPDLPRYNFLVATGNRMPAVSVEPLEWVEVDLPGGLAGVPERVILSRPEARRDAAGFAAARTLDPEVSGLDTYRGMPLRRVSVPLATYAEGESRARALKRFRVRVDFPDPGAMPNPGAGKWLRQSGVLNPSGGAYLVAPPRSAPLRKAAAASAFDPAEPWLKIRIGNRIVDDMAEDGMYSLTYEAAAARGLPFGIPVGKLRVYAGPKDTATTRIFGAIAPTLSEIPIEVRESTPADSTFGAGDTILFYAHGTSLWIPVSGGNLPEIRWQFISDPWSFENHYFLQWSGTATGALRLQSSAGPEAADTATSAPHYLRAERDLTGGSCEPTNTTFDEEGSRARYWYGRFSCIGTGGSLLLTASQLRSPSWDTLPGRVSDSAWIGFFTYTLGTGSSNGFLTWKNLSLLPYQSTSGLRGAWYLKTSDYGDAVRPLFDSVRWNTNEAALEGYTVRYVRSLKWSEGRVVFPSAFDKSVAYRVEGVPEGGRILRLEEGVGARWIALQSPGGADLVFSDSAASGEDVKYLFTGQGLPLSGDALTAESGPTGERVVQDLRTGAIGGIPRNPDYLIIAPSALLPEAVALAKYRDHEENPSQPIALRPAVVRVEDIYREWSGGRLSPVAIRDFVHWARDRWGAGGTTGDLKYLLLFGDGHYDVRNFRNGASSVAMPNHIPPFIYNGDISSGSGDPMSTDDFYAVVDSGKNWQAALDLAVGRLPVQTREQARDYLEKIARYENPKNAGAWRSRILLTGDDATQRRNPGGRDPIPDHTRMAEDVGNMMLALDSGLRKESIYLFDYPSNAQFLKPEATQALVSNLNLGLLFFTFFGHGAYNQLADEVFLKTNDGLARIRNGDRGFGMLIFSCTVGRFDKLADEGMVEQFVRAKGNGAVFGIAGTRETRVEPNESLGKTVASTLYAPAADTAIIGVGEVLRRAKSLNGNVVDNRKYGVLGEPVLVVNRPGLGLSVDARPDSLQALGCDTLRGRVSQGSGRGAVNLRIVSGDVPKSYQAQSLTLNVKKRGQILFERTVPYVDSTFELPYFLPKQVPFGDTAAKLQLFAWDSLEARESALLIADMPISGTIADNTCLVNDSLGPRVTVTGCNTREAGEVDFPDKVRISLPYCLQVTVTDTGGGVIAGEGPDQGVTMELVGSLAPFQPQATSDDLYQKSYQVQLSPQEISNGSHLFKVSARDGFGNLTQRQITLQVAQDTVLRFVRAFNTPNPLKRGETTFWFSTTLPVEEGGDLTSPNQNRIRFHVRVFNQRGYMVKEFRGARSGETRWDGRDAWGRTLANGIYFYDVTATWGESDGGPAGGRSVSRRNTLVISR